MRILAVVPIAGLLAMGLSGAALPPGDAEQLPDEHELAFAEEVAAFVQGSPAPDAQRSAVEDFDQYALDMLAYWEAVPWDAVAGQWGCTVQVDGPWIDELDEPLTHPDGSVQSAGSLAAQINFITDADCASGLTDDILKVEPREFDEGRVAPQAWNDSCGGGGSLTTLCLGRTSTYVASWSWTNNALWGTHTADDQIWNANPSCGATAPLAGTGNITLSPGQRNTASRTVNYNGIFLNILYSWNGSSHFANGSHCAAM